MNFVVFLLNFINFDLWQSEASTDKWQLMYMPLGSSGYKVSTPHTALHSFHFSSVSEITRE
jgi:hypothetical protein